MCVCVCTYRKECVEGTRAANKMYPDSVMFSNEIERNGKQCKSEKKERNKVRQAYLALSLETVSNFKVCYT